MRRDVVDYDFFIANGRDAGPEDFPGMMMVRILRCSHLTVLTTALAVVQLVGQEPPDTFGPSLLRSLPVRIASILRVESDTDSTDRLLGVSSRGRKIYALRVGSDGTALVDSLIVAFPFDHVRLDPNAPGQRRPILVLRLDTLVLYELVDEPGKRLRLTEILAPGRRVNAAFHDDVNKDGLDDLLLVDEEEPGILPVYRTPRGGWRRGRVAAPDLMVRKIATVHLNNDGLVDMLAYDWVRSELHLVYGIGRERFLDQGGLPVEGSVDNILIDPVSEHHPLRVTLVDKEHSALSYMEMDERGDLIRVARQDIADTVRSVYAVSVDSTFNSSFIVVSDSSVGCIVDAYVAQSPTLNSVALPGRTSASWLTDRKSVSVLLSGTMYDRLWHFSGNWPGRDSVVFAVPPGPVAVLVRDYDGDGHDDMAFVSGRKGTISFVWGSENGRFRGAEELSGPPGPIAVIGQSIADPRARFYSTHDSPPSISITEVEWQDLTVVTSKIPLQGKTELIGEFRSPSDRTTLSAVHRGRGKRATFATYERIRQDSFLEQTLDLGPPAVLFGASMGLVDDDSVADAILLYRPDDSSDVSLGISFGDSSTAPPRISVRSTLPVKDPRVAYMWQTDANRDSLPDLVVVFPNSAKEVYALFSKKDSLYAYAIRVDTAVAIDARQHFDVVDVDRDGFPDLVAIVRGRGGLGWWQNAGDGTFRPWELLVPGLDISSFAFGGLMRPGGSDVVVTRRQRNTATVYAGWLFPWGRP